MTRHRSLPLAAGLALLAIVTVPPAARAPIAAAIRTAVN
jgi:hypothetical protein